MFNVRKSLLAAACSLAIMGQASAVTVNESFDGSWGVFGSGPARNKGLLVDYIPSVNTFFFAFFSYDQAGNQLWTVGSFLPEEGVFDYADVPVEIVTGGVFNAEGTPASTPVGTVDISLTCGQISIAFSPTQASGLQAAAFDLQPSLGLDSLTSGECNMPVAACPTGTTAQGNDCKLPATISNDLFLPAGKKYIVEGRVSVEDGGTMTIAPGVTVQGGSSDFAPNFISVKVGARIYAQGTRNQPITFTGPEPVPGSWAGLVIAGRSICNDGTEAQPCQFEAVPDITYGSTTPVLDDSSGALEYVRVLYAGQQIAPNEELNSVTLLAVGSGTKMSYVQVDSGLDDGFEMFGGSVNGDHLVCSNMGDDCYDFDQGYNGELQFGLGWQGTNPDQTTDSNGFETDNDSSNNDKLPRTTPTVANFTMVGNPSGTRDGMRIRRGAGGAYSNMVVTNYTRTCLNLDDAGTFGLGTAAAQGDQFTFTNSFIGGCVGGTFDDAAGDAYAVSTWYAAGTGNGTGDPMLVSGGFLPAAGSPVLSGGDAPDDATFRPTQFRGAFSGPNDNWTAGWTVNLPNQ